MGNGKLRCPETWLELQQKIRLTKIGFGYYFGYDYDKISERESAAENFSRPARRAQRPQPVHRIGLGGKISRQSVPEWKPTTARGRRMAALLEKGKSERYPLLNEEEFERELRERRGRFA